MATATHGSSLRYGSLSNQVSLFTPLPRMLFLLSCKQQRQGHKLPAVSPPLSSRSETVCLASSDLLHMHLALADTLVIIIIINLPAMLGRSDCQSVALEH